MIKQHIRNAPCLVGLRCVGKCRPQKEIKFTGLHSCVVLEVLSHVCRFGSETTNVVK